jgi:hypothetical protein
LIYKPSYTFFRYNEIGEPLFFIDIYTEKDIQPFSNKLTEGHPIYQLSFIHCKYDEYISEAMNYMWQKFWHEEELDNSTFFMLMNNALDRILNDLPISSLEHIPSYYFGYSKNSLKIDEFRADKNIVEEVITGYYDKQIPLRSMNDFLRIMNYYLADYGLVKFQQLFEITFTQISEDDLLKITKNSNSMDVLLDSFKCNHKYFKIELEELSIYLSLDAKEAITFHYINYLNDLDN